MTIASELTALQTNLENAYDAVEAKGGTLPAAQNFDNLDTAIGSIPSGGGDEITATNTTGSAVSADDKVWVEPVRIGTRNFTLVNGSVNDSTFILTCPKANSSVYAYIAPTISEVVNSFSIVIKVKVTTDWLINQSNCQFVHFGSTTASVSYPGLRLYCWGGINRLTMYQNGTTYHSSLDLSTLVSDTWYWFKYEQTGTSAYSMSYSTDGTTWTSIGSDTGVVLALPSSPVCTLYQKASTSAERAFEYDLSECFLMVNNTKYSFYTFTDTYSIIPSADITSTSFTGIAQANIANNATGSVKTLLDGNGTYAPTTATKSITTNGTYTASAENAYGLSEVTVNVQTTLQDKIARQNGIVTADTGYDGLSQVDVEVPQIGESYTATNYGSSTVSEGDKVWLNYKEATQASEQETGLAYYSSSLYPTTILSSSGDFLFVSNSGSYTKYKIDNGTVTNLGSSGVSGFSLSGMCSAFFYDLSNMDQITSAGTGSGNYKGIRVSNSGTISYFGTRCLGCGFTYAGTLQDGNGNTYTGFSEYPIFVYLDGETYKLITAGRTSSGSVYCYSLNLTNKTANLLWSCNTTDRYCFIGITSDLKYLLFTNPSAKSISKIKTTNGSINTGIINEELNTFSFPIFNPFNNILSVLCLDGYVRFYEYNTTTETFVNLPIYTRQITMTSTTYGCPQFFISSDKSFTTGVKDFDGNSKTYYIFFYETPASWFITNFNKASQNSVTGYAEESIAIGFTGSVIVGEPSSAPTKKYNLLDRVTDDSNNEIGTVSGFFTDANNVEYAVVCLDAQYRLASSVWCNHQGTGTGDIVTNLPVYDSTTWGPWEAKETATFNTQKILDYCTAGGYTSTACSHCRSKSFTIDGTTYYGQLPNMIELNDIVRNHTAINTIDTTASSYSSVNFSTNKYVWSSNQYSYGNAYLAFNSGSMTNYERTSIGLSTVMACPVLEIPNT